MRLFKLLVFSFMLLGLAACSKPDTTAQEAENEEYVTIKPYFNTDWAMDKLWDDGLAEVAVYDAERVVYGNKRSFDLTIITVKEDFNKEYNVKTDDYKRDDLFPVMKVNQFCSIQTDSYPYHYLTSVFIRREQPWYLHKLTTSSQEWCGNTFKAITRERNFNLYYNSYFDGQGEGNWQLPNTLLFEDQLPYSLRALKFQDGLTFKADIAETQQTNKATQPKEYKAIVSTIKSEINNKAAWQVNVQLAPGKVNTYWFATEYPNILLRQQTWDGRTLELKKISRYAYWEGN
ncbi:hypothetical protein JAO76_12715 [Pontibacter sp. BT310]|uniref:Lipoprotein n=1 Tax=Pontibacter populi TaxID=890055 RepID=A0ABS6XFM3_9BACT|nr:MULTISPECIES: hypothetical protein [Pontibacter]MBJ6119062.1 hypothetical protein [Pontibacter sp. BT310]MBR0571490.1 hypothetical protein [Microvirga sp. STS03]MBW3365916.1 hypothetical protein [Pontibacter populi]